MKNNKYYVVILDCYTDEPSGFGVRPYLGTHQIHLSQALVFQGIDHYYLTIEDLRYCSNGIGLNTDNTDLLTFNRTKNCDNALSILHNAAIIYVVMGCFVDYSYFSCVPPRSNELYTYLKDTKAKKILFYVLGTSNTISSDYQNSLLKTIIDDVEHGNTYRYVIESDSISESTDLITPNYELLDKVSNFPTPIISQLRYPIIAEIECGTGCNTPFCKFCIESIRAPRVIYRDADSIIKQIKTLYNLGVRHFRLGRQPNFYHFHNQNLYQMEKLLAGIREACSEIEMLHIDNVNMINVISRRGKKITKLIVRYCTSGNITPFGIESFDEEVRKATRIIGSADQALKAIEIINEYGQERGPDGLPRLLPGINLIYNLPGQTQDTHRVNLEYLSRILSRGWQTRRLFFRKMTPPTGISFSSGPVSDQEYENWFEDIVDNYVLPMQDKVYPAGTVVRGHREVIWKNGDSYLRTLGTCPIRVVVKGCKLEPYKSHDIRIKQTLGYRLLEGEVVNAFLK